MGRFYDLTKNARGGNSEALLFILKSFEPKIYKYLSQTDPQDRDDLLQELRLMIIEEVFRYNIETIPSFWELQEKIQH